jgi:DhnA family fructose-bisphosphate aldolase class Ia
MTGKEIRLRRLFSQGNAVIVAADHGEFDGPIPGLIDLPRALSRAVNRAVNGVLLSPGMIGHCGDLFATRDGPLAVVRLNWNSVYAFHWGYSDAAGAVAVTAQEALALGADIVLASLTLRTGSEQRDAENVAVFCQLVQEARRLGLPAIGEFFPARSHELTKEEMHDLVRTGCRVAAELGADLIKTFYTYRFQEVVAGCPVPILGLGAEKADTQLQALQLAESEIRDGARGVVFGRNALQVPDPQRFQAALCAVVREGVSAEEAAHRFELADSPGG